MSTLVQPIDDVQPAPLAYVGNHVDRALGTLSARFADPEKSPNLHALITARVEQLQSLEDVAQAWMTLQTVEGAEGIYLDWWGLQVGQGRGSDDDATYRIKLRAAGARNRSDGSNPDLLLVLTLLLGDLVTQIQITPVYPAGIYIVLYTPAPLSAAQQEAVVDFSLASVAGGVGILGIAEITGRTFAYSTFPDPPYRGYDDGTGNVGGYWANYFYP